MSTIIPYIYLGIGGCFLVYFVTLWIYCGRIPAFGWFWPLVGSAAIILGAFTYTPIVGGPDGITTLFFDENLTALRRFCTERLPLILMVLMLLFLIMVYVISKNGKKQLSTNADVLIILGAHVNGTKPSKALMSRILMAYNYLKENPHTKAVLTGGQGWGEDITEAFCMKRELLGLGIEEERLFEEDRSTTTVENIRFAKTIIEKEICSLQSDDEDFINQASIVVVTNDFHALRGSWIAKKEGFHNVQSIGASSSTIMKLHYYTRETLSWMKLFLVL